MSDQTSLNELRNRYPGVKPFSSSEKELFFGREKDIEDLHSLLFIKQTVVLYGKSGYGKSSLLNAGIIPRLDGEGEWYCFSIRFNNYSEREKMENVSPIENIKLRLKQDIPGNATSILDTVIQGEDSFWYWVKNIQERLHKSQFIFFFDQFEELFTYPKVNIEEFSEQLSQLLYNTVPVKFRKRISEMDEKGEVSDELHNHLLEKPEVKVVFSLRSDRLSLLNSLTDKHPTILQNYYELNALTRTQAEQAIINPAKSPQLFGFLTPPFEYTKMSVDKIINGIMNAQDGKIETSTLQIICRYVEDELVENKKYTLITEELLGDIANIFKKYYEGVLTKLEPKERGKVQHLIEDELIEEGRRNTLTEGYIRNRFGFDEKLLRQLEQSSLLRKERDAAGRILYEISHDTLVGAIELVASERRQVEEKAKRDKLEETLRIERKKANDLLTLNRKVVNRSRLAITLAFFSLLIAASAVYFWYESKLSGDKAKIEEEKAKIILFRINLRDAKVNEDAARQYLISGYYEDVIDALNAVDSLMVIDVKLPSQDAIDRNALLDFVLVEKGKCMEKILAVAKGKSELVKQFMQTKDYTMALNTILAIDTVLSRNFKNPVLPGIEAKALARTIDSERIICKQSVK